MSVVFSGGIELDIVDSDEPTASFFIFSPSKSFLEECFEIFIFDRMSQMAEPACLLVEQGVCEFLCFFAYLRRSSFFSRHVQQAFREICLRRSGMRPRGGFEHSIVPHRNCVGMDKVQEMREQAHKQ